MKTAIIYGITGQDGFYLTQELLRQNYQIIGVTRRSSTNNTTRLTPFLTNKNLTLVEGDVTDCFSIANLINKYRPDEIYNLSAQSVTEESYLPVKIGNNVKYITFKELWDNQIKYNKKDIRIEDFNGTEVEVIDIDPTQNSICALGHANSAGNWYNITQISRHKWNGKIAKLSQKFGSVCVTPNHSLIDIFGKVVQPETNPWMLNIRKINSVVKKPIDSICAKMPGYKNSPWLFKKESGRIGYVKEYIDNIEAICRFVGAFVAEGHTCFNTANNTYTVNISEQSIEWLESLQKDLYTFFDGRSCITRHKKEGYDDVYTLEIKSRYLYDLMRHWCGKDSHNKQLPEWFTKLSKDHASILFNKMIEGDGCFNEDGSWRYTTSSYKLACQFSWLVTYLGCDYTVNEEDNNHSYWHFRSCSFYQLNKGEDGKKITWLDYDGYVYDITVDEVHNFTVGVGNIVVHNSHVATSFVQPSLTWDIVAGGCLNILEAIRNISPSIKFYQASSSEMFGKNYSVSVDGKKYQNEDTPMMPQSPYAIAKLAAHHLVRNYRDSYGMFACSGILFNHESPMRGENFVTRKITKWIGGLCAISRDNADISFYDDYILCGNIKYPKLRLGNLEAKRDWGHAKDYCRAMYLMLQQDAPDDYVVSTQETHSVREFLDVAFKIAHLGDYNNYIVIDPAFYRPAEVDYLLGNSTKARSVLKWSPDYDFPSLVEEMVEHDIHEAEKTRFGVTQISSR